MAGSDKKTTGLLWDDRFGEHLTGAGHPERPDRLVALRAGFERAGLVDLCMPLTARRTTDDELLTVHTPAYVQRVEKACSSGAPFVDVVDSAVCSASYEIARLAAGGVLTAVDAVMAGDVGNAFCAVRPPGHHAERSASMGFCLFANVAVAAQYLRDVHGLSRVAVVDWDVHHGNGTQHIFEETADVFCCSLHGHPAYVYPGTGFAEEHGRGDGDGATLNQPFYPGAGDDDYRRAFDDAVLPALEDYRPEFVLVSAGFDAHRRDPLAPLELDTASFGWMTRAVMDIAKRHASGRLVSVLEGGYDLQALTESAVLHIQQLNSARPTEGQP